MTQTLALALGGALGALMRYYLAGYIYALMGRAFPYGTLCVNLIGSFLMGFLSVYLTQRFTFDPAIKVGVLVGFLGALTTFSTFSFETLQLIQQAHYIRALMNGLLSVVLCVAGVALGMSLAGKVT